MILQYGTQRRPRGEVGLTVTRRPLVDGGQNLWGYEEVWQINGLITPRGAQTMSDSAARTYIKSQQVAVERMFAAGGLDLALLGPDGSASHHVLRNRDCTGGVRLTEPVSYGEPAGASLVTHCRYQVSFTGIRPTVATQLLGNRVLSFAEDCQFEGGGYRDLYVETARGLPQRQRGRFHTVYRATQKGSAVGLYSRPTIPPPIWPQALLTAQPALSLGHPRRVGSSLIEWPITWQYQFESAYPLMGFPNEWGQTYGI